MFASRSPRFEPSPITTRRTWSTSSPKKNYRTFAHFVGEAIDLCRSSFAVPVDLERLAPEHIRPQAFFVCSRFCGSDPMPGKYVETARSRDKRAPVHPLQ